MRAWITRDPIDPTAILAEVGSPQDGAWLLFLGVVRDHNEGRAVSAVRYEAYAPMAEQVLASIAREAADRLGTPHVALVHRVGELAVGEASVAIAVASPHRAEAFDACRHAIEEIKRRLPVWKEEREPDGSARWLDGVRPPIPETAAGPGGAGEPAQERPSPSGGPGE